MPLSNNTKAESKSIEDLIAQLDAPAGGITEDCDEQNADRKTLRAKRTTNNSGGDGGVSASGGAASYAPILNKNILISKKYTKSLKSVKGRGLAKKDGGGGNYTWGKPGCELNVDSVDQDDPNYDSEQDCSNYVMVCVDNEAAAATASRTDSDSGVGKTVSQQSKQQQQQSVNMKQPLDLDEFDTNIKPVVLEYFLNGDSVEVIDYVSCYDLSSSSKMRVQLIAFIIQLALENNNTKKELTSRLLRDFHYDLFKRGDFEGAFDSLLRNLNDLTLDNPDAIRNLGVFIARCIADKVLSYDYLTELSLTTDDAGLNEKIQQTIAEARVLTNINEHLFHLSHIWGHSEGGFTAVKDLTDKISVVIQEFYDSGDCDEAARCLKELNVPHFHHEFIYEALDFILQKSDDQSIELVTNLFKRLYVDSVIVTYDQLKMGFTRIYDLLPDICLDVPNANSIMDKIISVCQAKQVINNDIAELGPNRSRKRFVSEGDGGRLKDEN